MAWQIGDLAVCVDNNPDYLYAEPAISAFARLEVGRVYRVLRIGENDRGSLGIDIGVQNKDLFAGFNDIWPPDCFRKVAPDKREACEPEFVTLIKRAKRPVTA